MAPACGGMPVSLPGSRLLGQGERVGYPSVQTLCGEDADLGLGPIQPTLVFGRVMHFQTLHQPPRLSWGKRFIQGRRLRWVLEGPPCPACWRSTTGHRNQGIRNGVSYITLCTHHWWACRHTCLCL